MRHHLKIENCYFEAVLSGDKRFEIRFNDDRGFQKGDTIELNEISKASGNLYTGRKFGGIITYVTPFMQKEGYVVFGFQEVT